MFLNKYWKFAQKLFLSPERFCSNNFEYISTSPTVIYVGQSDSIQMVGCCFTVWFLTNIKRANRTERCEQSQDWNLEQSLHRLFSCENSQISSIFSPHLQQYHWNNDNNKINMIYTTEQFIRLQFPSTKKQHNLSSRTYWALWYYEQMQRTSLYKYRSEASTWQH